MTRRRYHDIPMSRREVVDALLEAPWLDDADRQRFDALAGALAALFHHEFHAELEELKDAYRPINPDVDWQPAEPASESRQLALSDRVEQALQRVLARGNYRRLADAELKYAFGERSLFPLRVEVDFSVVDDFIVYARGESVREIDVPKWFGLRKKRVATQTYDRVCLYLRFKPDPGLDPKRRKLLTYEPGLTVLKLFRSIPKADLEMLFPNTRLKMRWRDRLWIGVPAVVGGVPILTKLSPALFAIAILLGLRHGHIDYASAIAGLGGLIGLGIFVVRQWDKFNSRKMLFLKMVSENLYFRNIDNNDGVLTRLVDEAEEEEHKEALLAYYFLLREPGLTTAALDERIEDWLKAQFGVDVDFEIDDALAKLVRLGLAEEDAGGGYRVAGLAEALDALRARWGQLLG